MSDAEGDGPLLELEAAVEKFVATTVDHPSLVTGAILVWETACFHEGHAQPAREIDYANVSSSTSAAGCIGLAVAGAKMLQRDLLDDDFAVFAVGDDEDPPEDAD